MMPNHENQGFKVELGNEGLEAVLNLIEVAKVKDTESVEGKLARLARLRGVNRKPDEPSASDLRAILSTSEENTYRLGTAQLSPPVQAVEVVLKPDNDFSGKYLGYILEARIVPASGQTLKIDKTAFKGKFELDHEYELHRTLELTSDRLPAFNSVWVLKNWPGNKNGVNVRAQLYNGAARLSPSYENTKILEELRVVNDVASLAKEVEAAKKSLDRLQRMPEDPIKLNRNEATRVATDFALALGLAVNSVYTSAGKQLPQQTLYLQLRGLAIKPSESK